MKIINQASEVVSIDSLRPHPRNVNQGDLGAIHNSITANGFYGNVVAQRSSGHILAGSHRWQAAQQAGLVEIPVTWVDVDDDAALRIMLADNRTARLGNDDEQALADLLKELADDGGLEGSGYDGDDLDQLLEDLGRDPLPAEEAPEAQIDKAEELRVKWGVEYGQLWQVGRHRLLCGDSTNAEDVARLMGGNKAEMMFTDPPYGVDYDGGHFHSGNVNIKRAREKLAADDNTAMYDLFLPVTLKHVDGPCYMWFAGSKARDVYNAVHDNRCEVHALIIWHKINATYAAMNAQYKQRHEPCLYFKPKGSTLRWVGPSDERTIWEIARDARNEHHPTQKPVELARRAIGNHEANTVADFFAGSGSTIIAAEQEGRICYALELDPGYVAVILQRLADMKLEPVLLDQAQPVHAS